MLEDGSDRPDPFRGEAVFVPGLLDQQSLHRADPGNVTPMHHLASTVGVALAGAIELHHPPSGRHHRAVAHLAGLIARDLGRPPGEIEGIRLAASLHDIGKLGVPRGIIDHPGRLSLPDLRRLQTHAEAGYTLLRGIGFPWPVADMVRQHHERLDGSGYPDGLAGDAILPGARIIAVADLLEAMTADRAYRRAPGLAAGLAELRRGRGVLYDAAAADACIALCTRDPAGALPFGAAVVPDDATAPATVRLTAQQQIVMHLLAEGRSTKEIARALGLGLGTVKVHLSRAYATLGASNRVAAVRAMLRAEER